MSKQALKSAEVTDAIIKKWKETYGTVFEYSATDNSGIKAFFRSPDNADIDNASSVGNQPMKSNLILAKACFLGGDEEVFTEKKYWNGLNRKLTLLIQQVEGEMTEL